MNPVWPEDSAFPAQAVVINGMVADTRAYLDLHGLTKRELFAVFALAAGHHGSLALDMADELIVALNDKARVEKLTLILKERIV